MKLLFLGFLVCINGQVAVGTIPPFEFLEEENEPIYEPESDEFAYYSVEDFSDGFDFESEISPIESSADEPELEVLEPFVEEFDDYRPEETTSTETSSTTVTTGTTTESSTASEFTTTRPSGIQLVRISGDEAESQDEDYSEQVLRTTDVPDYYVECKPKSMCLYISRPFLRSQKPNPIREEDESNFMLSGMSEDVNGVPCSPWIITVDNNEPVNDDYVQMCSVANNDGSWTCGTTQTENEFDITYANQMSFTRGTYSFNIGFDCVWNNTIYVFDEIGFQWNPTRYLSVTIPGQGIGRFLVTMNLFKTPLFDTNDIYNEPPKLMITDNNNLHVGLRYLQPSNGGVLQVLALWATPSTNFRDEYNHVIVSDGCVATRDMNVTELTTSGATSFVKYIFPVFKFPDDPVVYLHAQVRICFPSQLEPGDTCAAQCARRKRAATTSDELENMLTLGPIMIDDSNLAHRGYARLDMKRDMTRRELNHVIQLTFVIVIALIIIIILAIIFIMLRRAKKDKQSTI